MNWVNTNGQHKMVSYLTLVSYTVWAYQSLVHNTQGLIFGYILCHFSGKGLNQVFLIVTFTFWVRKCSKFNFKKLSKLCSVRKVIV